VRASHNDGMNDGEYELNKSEKGERRARRKETVRIPVLICIKVLLAHVHPFISEEVKLCF